MAVRLLLSRRCFAAADLFVCALIMALGALPFFLYEKAPDFLHADAAFADRADSLLHGSYSLNSVPENVEPPGLPVILALVCVTVSCTHNTLSATW